MTFVTQLAPTVGEIARRIGCPIHRVEYLIRSRRLKPREKAGNARVFSDEDVRFIEAEIRRIDTQKGVEHDSTRRGRKEVPCG